MAASTLHMTIDNAANRREGSIPRVSSSLWETTIVCKIQIGALHRYSTLLFFLRRGQNKI